MGNHGTMNIRMVKRGMTGVAILAAIFLGLHFYGANRHQPHLSILRSSETDFGRVFTVLFTNSSRSVLTVDTALKWIEKPGAVSTPRSPASGATSYTVWFRKEGDKSGASMTLSPGEYGYIQVPVVTNDVRFKLSVAYSIQGGIVRKWAAQAAAKAYRVPWLRRWFRQYPPIFDRYQYLIETPWTPNDNPWSQQ